MAKVILNMGRGKLYSDLRFVGEVAGGGAVGPGKVYKVFDYGDDKYVFWDHDFRSGSKRSGSCVWQLEKDSLYVLHDIAYSSKDSCSYHLSTYGELPEELSTSEFYAEKRRIWPLGFQKAEDAKQLRIQQEAERIVRDTAEAARREIERAALAEINAEKAAEIEKDGQPDVGLPMLKGSPKQIAYAISIREAFAKKNPGDGALKKATTAKYWIENHRRVLYA